ncbi:Argonaute-2, partial [Ephemera danica]
MQDLYGQQNCGYGRQDNRQYGQSEFNVDDIMRQFQQDRYDLLQNYIRGLKIEYIIPGQPNSKRTLRVN